MNYFNDQQPVDDDEMFAVCAPSNGNASLRQGELSQDARDLLAWAFGQEFQVNPAIPIPMNSVELRIGGDECNRIAFSDDGGFIKHGGSDSMRYMKHSDDKGWALVFAHDCDGCKERGRIIADRLVASRRS